jgi:hypothetical protein
MSLRPSNERARWDLLNTQTPESAEYKAYLDRHYASLLPYLRDMGGLTACMEFCAKDALNGGITPGYFDSLNDVHPRALLLLAKYGVEFKPYLWAKPPQVEPGEKLCFGNASIYQRFFNLSMRRGKSATRLSYVEGVAFGAHTEAVLHGWNCIADTTMAIDMTWYAVTGWVFYFGIPLAQGQYRMLRKLAHPTSDSRPLFRPDCFARIEEPLTEILEKRRRIATPAAAA